ncbi:antibiotic biosynthesis monooxygenase [Rhodococcus sp. KBS0724]|uniref:antibiotic biosynthesis monooxygenase n=1 Tax=Rhodococcus sp. KBS0724 TaxID=1179674 RepID=UPI00110EE7EE|nr:antibiotic biosynthesis monooxygenase [Rhodococcus sp. KBS0724]TSD46137.1 antibiotic biosynthesis monooxygenase [Rhodococcus sp. KBS0724]
MPGSATVVTAFHRPENGDGEVFAGWTAQAVSAAKAARGYLGSAVSDGFGLSDYGVSHTFSSVEELHGWLDSPAHSRVQAQGIECGVRAKSSDLVLVEDAAPPPGIGVYDHTVVAGRQDEFLRTQHLLIAESSLFSGYESALLLCSTADATRWQSVLRFRTEPQLAAWMHSEQRAAVLPALREELAEDFTESVRSTPFGTILRTENGQTRATPNWKTAMIVLLVLYPTVMTLSRFLGPVLDDAGAPPWLSMWLSQIISVGAMTWFLMPAATRWFGRWLDPFDGAKLRANVLGTAAVLAIYVGTLALFASVKWLQFWDYFD